MAGRELWRTDGTASGTRLVKDIFPDTPNSSSPIWLSDVNGTLMFGANDGKTYGLWRSDGTAAGTGMVAPVPIPEYPYVNPVVSGGLLFVVAAGYPTPHELWRSDGTPGGTFHLATLALPNPLPAQVAGDGRIFFQADDGSHGWEPWTSDGTVAGTSMAKDILPGESGSLSYVEMFGFHGRAYFGANDGSGIQLWVTDGTESGTRMLKQVMPPNSSANPGGFGILGDRLLFVADSWLWSTDGTEAGTEKLVDISAGGGGGQATSAGGLLFSFARVDNYKFELWRTDGTAGGTLKAANVQSAAFSMGPPTEFRGQLFFTNLDNWGLASLWRSDGTPAGTGQIAHVSGGWAYQWTPPPLTRVGDRLYFAGGDDTHGVELWVSDGTPEGTSMVDDTVPGTGSLGPTGLTLVGDTLFFAGTAPQTGTELWALHVNDALDPRRTTTSIRSTRNVAPYGSALVLTVLVESPAGAPTGTAVLREGGTTLAELALTPSTTSPNTAYASFTPPIFEVGDHTLAASYGGDARFEPSESLPTHESIIPAPTSVALSGPPNPVAGGQPVTLTATVDTRLAAAARGSVTFRDAAAGVIGSADLDTSGQAHLVTGSLAGGAHFLTAEYGGEPRFLPSASGYTEVVVNAPSACSAFTAVWSYQYGLTQLAAADLNGDGAADLVGALGGTPLDVRLSLGDGRLGDRALYWVTGGGYGPNLVDVNGDGRPDIVDRNGGLQVFMNDGSGAFTRGWSGGLVSGDALAVADFNGDGFTDLLGSSIGWPKIAFGDGHGGFTVGRSFELLPLWIQSLGAGDFDGDGNADLVVLDRTHGTLAIVFGHGDGTFAPPVLYAIGGSLVRPPVVADLNGDGTPDVVVVDSATQEEVVFVCNRDGTLREGVRYPMSESSLVLDSVIVGDFDGDGVPDLLGVPSTLGAADLEFRLGRGDGSFAEAVRVGICEGATAVAAGDFNGDGKLDLIVSTASCGTQVLLNSCGVPAAPKRSLRVTKSGTGFGTVASDSSGIDCGTTCSAWFAFQSVVTLVATPDAGSYFGGWSGGGCSGFGACTVAMDESRSVSARFAIPNHRVRPHIQR